ncbi:MAG: grasp-with-spasm system ATP-grasp peptide maturase [Crocinitomix sp.]|nr:grasp-with-spasm system ATP-grasp peptide maturase [Crocinitomix sp.]
MILIITESNDLTTNEVIDWLLAKSAPYIRINAKDAWFSSFDLQTKTFVIKTKNQTIHSNELSGVWYRRGGISFNFDQIEFTDKAVNLYLNRHLRSEYGDLQETIYKILKTKNSINSDLDNRLNKLDVLVLANTLNLNIPQSIITDNREDILNFMNSFNVDHVVTKSIRNGVSFWDTTLNIEEFTSKITKENLDDFPLIFFPSLIQENIPKKYEIRSFYLNGKTYSVAVFSQANLNTQIDGRKANSDKPHRVVPFTLPKKLNKKIKKLMDRLELNSGSLDFIYGQDEKFYFLEVNPIGQFAQVSFPGNYYLEELVASTLIDGIK